MPPDPNKPLSPWVPISDQVTVALLGKFLEELGECTAIVSRCLIQGIDGVDPDTGLVNRDELTHEIADVRGMTAVVKMHLGLDIRKMDKIAVAKIQHIQRWMEIMPRWDTVVKPSKVEGE